MNWQTIGHLGAKRILEKHLERESFSHAYLIVGQLGVGKAALAREFASKVLGVELSKLVSHPDFRFITSETIASSEGVRDLLRSSVNSPLVAKYNVTIIDGVETINLTGANSLLKTLEEPTEHQIFILIAQNRDLLPTLVSRCQVLALNHLSNLEMQKLAELLEIKTNPSFIESSGGSIARLIELSSNSEASKKTIDQLLLLNNAVSGQVFNRLAGAQHFFELEDEDLDKLINAWLWQSYRELGNNPELFKRVRAILSAQNKLNLSLNKKMVLERLFLDA